MLTPRFNAETHAYTTPQGRSLISVTQALSRVGIINTDWFTEQATWRGSVVHRVCELDDKGTLLESSIDPAAMPYLDGWRECKCNLGLKFVTIEQPLYHPELMYAGTPDRCCQDADIDLKSGVAARWHALQLVAYNNLNIHPRTRRRYTVRLPGNGKYVVTEYPPPTWDGDWAVFQSALNVCKWKGIYG